jgi:signal transduction histidine kinase
MDPSLKAEGIHLVWEVQDVNIATPLTPRNVLNLTRIFQEALTNVVKHSGANQVIMRTDIVVHDDQHWVAITLSDNGNWRTPSSSTSHGLANMQKRAQQLGGVLRLVCTDRGSAVELLLSAHP